MKLVMDAMRRGWYLPTNALYLDSLHLLYLLRCLRSTSPYPFADPGRKQERRCLSQLAGGRMQYLLLNPGILAFINADHNAKHDGYLPPGFFGFRTPLTIGGSIAWYSTATLFLVADI